MFYWTNLINTMKIIFFKVAKKFLKTKNAKYLSGISFRLFSAKTRDESNPISLQNYSNRVVTHTARHD
jgi:hypothetical protein